VYFALIHKKKMTQFEPLINEVLTEFHQFCIKNEFPEIIKKFAHPRAVTLATICNCELIFDKLVDKIEPNVIKQLFSNKSPSLLVLAAYNQHTNLIKKIVKLMKKADVSESYINSKTVFNAQTPLYAATINGYADGVKEILEIPGVDPLFTPFANSDSAFVTVLCSNTIDKTSKIEIIMMYLKKFGIEFIKKIKSPLCMSAMYCSISEINIFLKPEYFANVTLHNYYPWEFTSNDEIKNHLLTIFSL